VTSKTFPGGKWLRLRSGLFDACSAEVQQGADALRPLFWAELGVAILFSLRGLSPGRSIQPSRLAIQPPKYLPVVVVGDHDAPDAFVCEHVVYDPAGVQWLAHPAAADFSHRERAGPIIGAIHGFLAQIIHNTRSRQGRLVGVQLEQVSRVEGPTQPLDHRGALGHGHQRRVDHK